MLSFAIALIAAAEVGAPAPPPASSTLEPFDEVGLANTLWRQSPDIAAARGGLVDAEAAERRAALLPNPALNAGWATIPLGRHNPAGLAFDQIPSYSVGLSQLVELGKRGPRREAARAATVESRLELNDLFRGRFLDLLGALGAQATSTGRAAVLARLVQDSEATLALQRVRATRGDVAGLEVDRLEVEHLRLLSQLGEAQASTESAAAACARLLGTTCPRFGSLEEALRFLSGPATEPGPANTGGHTGDDDRAIAARPDLRALQAFEARARAEELLATRQRIPDPTISASFTHDQFQAAGNQPNSVAVAVALPLPLFDRGQTEATRAAARAGLASRQRDTLREAARQALVADRRRLAVLAERGRRLDDQAIPMARTTAERLEAAARRGGAALQDVLLARRAMEELQLDRVDVAGETFAARLDIRRAAGTVPEPQGGAS